MSATLGLSNRCRWCGERFWIAPGYDAETERIRHEGRCYLSIPCPFCGSEVAEHCTVKASSKRCSAHSHRRMDLA